MSGISCSGIIVARVNFRGLQAVGQVGVDDALDVGLDVEVGFEQKAAGDDYGNQRADVGVYDCPLNKCPHQIRPSA